VNKLKIKISTLIILISFTTNLVGQNYTLESNDHIIYGPHNIKPKLITQCKYYIDLYSELEDEVEAKLSKSTDVFQQRDFNNDLKKIGQVLFLWELECEEDEESISIQQEMNADSCYELLTKESVLMFSDYEIVPSQWKEILYNDYIIDPIDTDELPKFVKRKKKNCTSTNPDECLVWCMVETEFKDIYFGDCPIGFAKEDLGCVSINFTPKDPNELSKSIRKNDSEDKIRIIGIKNIECN
jgi:hypothetical protein